MKSIIIAVLILLLLCAVWFSARGTALASATAGVALASAALASAALAGAVLTYSCLGTQRRIHGGVYDSSAAYQQALRLEREAAARQQAAEEAARRQAAEEAARRQAAEEEAARQLEAAEAASQPEDGYAIEINAPAAAAPAAAAAAAEPAPRVVIPFRPVWPGPFPAPRAQPVGAAALPAVGAAAVIERQRAVVRRLENMEPRVIVVPPAAVVDDAAAADVAGPPVVLPAAAPPAVPLAGPLAGPPVAIVPPPAAVVPPPVVIVPPPAAVVPPPAGPPLPPAGPPPDEEDFIASVPANRNLKVVWLHKDELITIYDPPLEKQNTDTLIVAASLDSPFKELKDTSVMKIVNSALVRGELVGRKFLLALGCATESATAIPVIDAAARAVGARPPPRELWLDFSNFPEHCEHQRAQAGAAPKLYELVGDLWRFKTTLRAA